MPHPRYSGDEIVRRGKELYERDIRPKVEADHYGKILVIDIETGDYEIDENYLAAADRVLARRPGAPLFGTRVGFRTLGRIGGRLGAAKP
jgi:hypothetical protein